MNLVLLFYFILFFWNLLGVSCAIIYVIIKQSLEDTSFLFFSFLMEPNLLILLYKIVALQ